MGPVVLQTTPPAGMADDFMLDAIVYIGRFQPLHIVHEAIIRFAAQHAKYVIVLVGSAEMPRTTRNPFLFAERASMINELSSQADFPDGNVIPIPLPDHLYNDTRWNKTVHLTVQTALKNLPGISVSTTRVGIIGGAKDTSSYYLGSFPAWANIAVDVTLPVHATFTRENWLRGYEFNHHVSPAVYQLMSDFAVTHEYTLLRQEQKFIDEYKASWSLAPYEPTFVCTDAVVVQAGHVLLIKRGDHPGKGLWALPGGFINPSETLLQCAVRELLEETGLRLTERIIRKSLVNVRCFDDPNRSARGRTFTHAHFFKLDDVDTGLPQVKGSDDAVAAEWVPLAKVTRADMFEDHYAILQTMVSL